MSRTIAGLKIRERRRALGLRQNELARRVGISPSYLHLIERNRRSVSGGLLSALGRELSLSLDELDGSAERRVRDGLAALAEDPVLGSAGMLAGDSNALIARFPDWAEGTVRAYSAYRASKAEVELQSDRLAHDQILEGLIHAMLTEITALRSIIEILHDGSDVSVEQRHEFETILDEQSKNLAVTGRALAAHFDRLTAGQPPEATEEAEEFLFRSGAGDALEATAERMIDALAPAGSDLEHAFRSALQTPPEIAPDWGRNRRLAALAFALASVTARSEIAEALDGCPVSARPHAQHALTVRLADAIRLPAPRFIARGKRLGWNIDALIRAADGEAPLVFRRIAHLHRSGAPRAGLITADASGATLERSGALDLLTRRRRLDCPLWPSFRATCGRAVRFRVRLSAEGERIAIALRRPDGPIIDMLVLAADALEHERAESVLEVGNGCHVCAHGTCPQRRETSIVEVMAKRSRQSRL